MNTPVTEEDLKEYLWGLGADADTVAASLRTLGVKGVRSSDCRCPVARALIKHFGIRDVSVMGTVRLAVLEGFGEGTVYTETPEAVKAFISRFDRGPHYADLVDE